MTRIISTVWVASLLLASLGCRMPDHPYKCCGALYHEQYEQNCDLYARAGSVLSPTFGPDFSGEVSHMKPIKKTDELSAPEPILDKAESNNAGRNPFSELDTLAPSEPPSDLPPDRAPHKTAPGNAPRVEPRDRNAPTTNEPLSGQRETMRPMVSSRQLMR